MENLNAEQIKKALEYCTDGGRCLDCQYDKGNSFTKEGCMASHMRDALALINSQEQRIKELAKQVERLTEENERLKKDNEYILMQHAFQRRPSGDCWNDVIEKAKADTVRKFAERLKERYKLPESNESYTVTPFHLHEFIDQIAKEISEEG